MTRKFLISVGLICSTAFGGSWLFFASSGGAWTPIQLSPTVWLRADLGVTKDGSDNVSVWADQSGHGNNYAQASGGLQPKWVSGLLNGQPGITFAGGKVLEGGGSSILSDASPMDAVVVVKLDSFSNIIPTVIVFAVASNTNPNFAYATGTSGDIFMGAATGGFRSGRARASLLTTVTGVYRYHRITYDGAGGEMSLTENATSLTNGTQPDTGSVPNVNLVGAALADGQYNFNGPIMEVFFVNSRNFTGGEWTSIQAYMTSQYGL